MTRASIVPQGWFRLGLLSVLLAGATAVAIACTGFGAADSETCTTCVDAGAGDTSTSPPGTDAALPVSCAAKSYDLAGCVCPTASAATPCYQGVPGIGSGCKDPGVQTCDQVGGELRWSACKGGSTPDAEACHDGIDNNCDGKIDEGCLCSDSVDICKLDGTAAAPGAYTMFTVPGQPKANEKFDLYVITRDKPLASPGLLKNGSICYGGGLARACTAPGAGCAGWKVGFFQGLSESAGSYTFGIKDPMGPTGCEGPQVASLVVVVAAP
jgi:hypothetical protein